MQNRSKICRAIKVASGTATRWPTGVADKRPYTPRQNAPAAEAESAGEHGNDGRVLCVAQTGRLPRLSYRASYATKASFVPPPGGCPGPCKTRGVPRALPG